MKPALVVVLGFLFVAAPSVLAQSLPTSISDKDFWAMVDGFSEPGGTFASDNIISNENLSVVLDTFHDTRNAFWFATNAMGAKWDAQLVNEGRDVNADWDGIWYVRSRIVDNGWSVEMAIPFSTLAVAPVALALVTMAHAVPLYCSTNVPLGPWPTAKQFDAAP